MATMSCAVLVGAALLVGAGCGDTSSMGIGDLGAPSTDAAADLSPVATSDDATALLDGTLGDDAAPAQSDDSGPLGDLALVFDFAAGDDVPTATDPTTATDLATMMDSATAADFSVFFDLATSFDLAAPLDLARSPDLAPHPDLAFAGPDARTIADLATPDQRPAADLALSPDGAGARDLGTSLPPTVLLPQLALRPADIAVLVNLDDPQSVAVGDYYQAARKIPAQNVIKLHLGVALGTTISAATFAAWKVSIDKVVPSSVQAYAVTWTKPSVVACMSLTSALAFGFDMKYCGSGCVTTAPSAYFNSGATAPYTKLGIRPAMIIAGATTAEATALIDRGVSSDDTFPTGDGWMITTTDVARSVRTFEFQVEAAHWASHPEELKLTWVNNATGPAANNYIQNQKNVLFYFTSLANVPAIATNTYRPGAMADHLTSTGGQIPTSGQMTILKWTEAGATGSYGTVVEPCNFTEKFPDVTVAVPTYYHGATLIEAYWQSVAWPGQGLFIGEPLAKPWGTTYALKNGSLVITTTAVPAGQSYSVESAPGANGPWTTVAGPTPVTYDRKLTITIPNASAPYYRFTP